VCGLSASIARSTAPICAAAAASRIGQSLQGAPCLGVEEPLGVGIGRDATLDEGRQHRLGPQVGHSIGAEAAKGLGIRIRGDRDRAQMLREQDHGRIGFERRARVQAVLGRSLDGVEARSNRVEAARIERLAVPMRYVVGHDSSPKDRTHHPRPRSPEPSLL
jgi:hypothetical protein